MDLSTTLRSASKEANQSQTFPFSPKEGLDLTNLATFPAHFSAARIKDGALGALSPLYADSGNGNLYPTSLWCILQPRPRSSGAGLAWRLGVGIRKHLSCSQSSIYLSLSLAPRRCFLGWTRVWGLQCLLSGSPGAVRSLPPLGPRTGALSRRLPFAQAMPAAAAPIISSVQKLVLYETRAVSTRRAGAGRRRAVTQVWVCRGGGSKPLPASSLVPALGTVPEGASPGYRTQDAGDFACTNFHLKATVGAHYKQVLVAQKLFMRFFRSYWVLFNFWKVY